MGWAGGTELGRHAGDVDGRDPLGGGLHPLTHPGQGQRPGGDRTAGGTAAAVQLGEVAVTGRVQLRPHTEELELLSLGSSHCHDVRLQSNISLALTLTLLQQWNEIE